MIISFVATILFCLLVSPAIAQTMPRILTNSSEISIIENTRTVIYIDCETTGIPKPIIQWKFGPFVLNNGTGLNGTLVNYELKGKNITTRASYLLFNNGTLRIGNPFTKSLVPYVNFTCKARNTAGEDSRTHQLFIEKLQSYTFEVVLPKEQLPDLEVKVRAKVRTLFQPGKLYYSLNIISVNLTNGTVDFELTWKERVLRVYGDPRDIGKLANDVYRVLKDGGLSPIGFQMNAFPAPPVDLIASDIKSDRFTISWKHPKYFQVDVYHVEMPDSSSNKWRKVKNVVGDKQTVTLDDLESETKYSVRLQSENRHGVGKIRSDVLLVQTTKGRNTVVKIVVPVILVLLIVLVLGILYYCRRKATVKHPDNPYQDSIPGISPQNIYVHNNMTVCLLGNVDSSGEQESFSWNEISRDSLVMGETLGQGEFGYVVKAALTDEQSKSDIPVAIKTVKDIATETDKKELFKELKLMADVAEHPNVVNLVGACSMKGPLLVIVEYCEHGDLLSYLQKNRKEQPGKEGTFVTSLDPLTRLRFAYDVSKGMCHLEGKKIVHRDLAARNVLLGKNKIAKVSDFGLSRDIYEAGLYQKTTGGRLPVKWMAIESLHEAKYTSKSDVWSFGILFWEIETAGMVPYPGMSSAEEIDYLLRGLRLLKPAETSSETYELMQTCWELSPKVRPDFQILKSKLEMCMEQRSPYRDSIPGIALEKIYADDQKTFCPLGNLDSSNKQGYFSWKEISRDCLVMGNVLGQGEFGLVVKAIWTDQKTNRDVLVAVKTVKDIAGETDKKELFKELRLMADVPEHPNVVNLVGACSVGGRLLVIVEFCEHGNLLTYLEENREEQPGKEGMFVTSLDPLTRVRFAYDVSKGMSHLEEKKIVHRDLAARNVLLGKNRIGKVSDFGLSRDIYEAGLYQKTTAGRLPVKWMAIESIQEAKYTSKSDVWSFGVLFWEIETAGTSPYPVASMSVTELLTYLQDGYRLPKPADTSSEIYEIMKSCWLASPQGRPRFQNLRSTLEKHIEQRSDYLPVVVNEDDSNGISNGAYVNYNARCADNETQF